MARTPGRFSTAATRWLYSKKNIAGCTLTAVAGPALVLTGVAAPPLALALLPAIYAIGALVAPSETAGQRTLVKAVAAGRVEDLPAAAARLADSTRGTVADDVQIRLDRIAETVAVAAPRLAGTPGDGDADLLRRTVSDYLPATLEPYLGLPRRYAETVAIDSGRTSKDLLCGQLDIIDDRLDRIADAALRGDAADIVTNGAFLADRFGTSTLNLPDESR